MVRLILLSSVLVGLAGCSDGNPRRYAVNGQVLFPDGRPLTTGTVERETLDEEEPLTATGTVSENGTFELGTFDVDDGAVAGRHRVVVLGDAEIGTGTERPGLLPPPTLHPRYRDYKTSGLEFTIEPDDNDIKIQVEYAPKPQRRRY